MDLPAGWKGEGDEFILVPRLSGYLDGDQSVYLHVDDEYRWS
jgi:hypothetical protein